MFFYISMIPSESKFKGDGKLSERVWGVQMHLGTQDGREMKCFSNRFSKIDAHLMCLFSTNSFQKFVFHSKSPAK